MSIRQPRNTRTPNVIFEWNSNFRSNWNRRFEEAQKIVDSEVIRLTDPLVPFAQGDLKNSAIRNTRLGSGLVRYVTPYAKRLYYNPRYRFRGAPTRGAYWFERGKRRYLRTIRRRVASVL